MPTFVLLTLTPACATTLSTQRQVDDNSITAALGNKYGLDSEVDRYRIDIDTLDGVVTLRGTVSDAEQISDAERIARSTDGVKEVSNQLSVDTTVRTVKDSFEDAWIVAMINSKLGVDPEVHSRNVDVDVHEGVVTLSGIVETETARAEVSDLAGSVDGVTKVVNQLTTGGPS